MKVLGADTSSSLSGHALLVDGVLDSTYVWRPDKKDDPLDKVYSYYLYTDHLLQLLRPDCVVMEELAMVRGAKTVRILRRIEAALIIACRKNSIPIYEVRVGTARKNLFGKDVKKEEAYRIVTEELELNHDWLPGTKKGGGLDEVDAYVCARAYNLFVEN